MPKKGQVINNNNTNEKEKDDGFKVLRFDEPIDFSALNAPNTPYKSSPKDAKKDENNKTADNRSAEPKAPTADNTANKTDTKIKTADKKVNSKPPKKTSTVLKAAFSECKGISVKTIDSDLFNHTDLFFDQNGCVYTTGDDLSAAMADSEKKSLKFFIYFNKQQCTYCLKTDGEKIMMSDYPISVEYQLGDKLYEPKPSHKITDIVKSRDIESEINQIKDKLGRLDRIAKNPERYIKEFKDKEKKFQENGYEEIRVRNAYLKGVDKSIYALEPKKPKKPSLGVVGWLWRAAVKLFSMGFSETDGYEEHVGRLEQYEEEKKEYNKKLEVYKSQKQIVDDLYSKELAALHKETEEAEKRAGNINAEIKKLTDRSNYLKFSKDIINNGLLQDLMLYQANTEVMIEGVEDLKKTGKITVDNIYANTWLKGGTVVGKKFSKLTDEDIDTLAEFIASRMAEDVVNNAALANSKFYQTEVSGIIAGLNNGSAVKAIRESPEFNEILKMKAEENAKVRPENVKNIYANMIRGREEELRDPRIKLKNERKALEEKFGSKLTNELNDKDFIEFARYAAVSEEIDKLEDKVKKGKPLDKTDTGNAMLFIQELHVNPKAIVKGEKSLINWSGMREQTMVTNIRDYMSKSYKKAFDTFVSSKEIKVVDLADLAKNVMRIKDPAKFLEKENEAKKNVSTVNSKVTKSF